MERLLLVLLSSCAALSDAHPAVHWNVQTGEVDCSVSPSVKAMIATTGLALLAGSAYAKSRNPSDVLIEPELYRGVAYAAAGGAAIAAVVSVLEWSAHARCRRLDEHVRALVVAHDCPTVVHLDTELSTLDMALRDSVRAKEPSVAACVVTGSGSAAAP